MYLTAGQQLNKPQEIKYVIRVTYQFEKQKKKRRYYLVFRKIEVVVIENGES